MSNLTMTAYAGGSLKDCPCVVENITSPTSIPGSSAFVSISCENSRWRVRCADWAMRKTRRYFTFSHPDYDYKVELYLKCLVFEKENNTATFEVIKSNSKVLKDPS